MDAMQFTLKQLLIASEWKLDLKEERRYTSEVADRIKEELIEFLIENNGATASQCGTKFHRGMLTMKKYLQELAREDKVIMRMNLHNKPATYVAKIL